MSQATTIKRPTDEDLFADGPIWRHGDWIAVPEWLAHTGLALPEDWRRRVQGPYRAKDFTEKLDGYLADAQGPHRQPVRFNPARKRDEDGWRYQSVKGGAPISINADVREFFEDLTPGSRWWRFQIGMLYRGDPVDGDAFARISPSLGVRCIVAACDPRLP